MNKKLQTIYIAALSRFIACVALVPMICACDPDNNFFHHPIEFKGAIEDSEMLITAHLEAGKTPCIFVNRSYFFKDSTALLDKEIYYRIGKDTTFINLEKALDYGWLNDATVEMQIADGAWEKLSCKQTTAPIDYFGMPCWTDGYCFVSDRILQEGDMVNIRVSHPDFPKKATVSQLIPLSPRVKVTKIDSTKATLLSLLDFKLGIPEYKGAGSDVMCFRATSYITEIRDYRWAPSDYSWWKDTIEYTHYKFEYVYSRGIGFSQYNNINTQLSSDYWGSDRIGLYHNANQSGTTTRMNVKAIYEPYYDVIDANNIRYTGRTDSVVLEVVMMTKDAYLQNASMIAGNYYSVQVADLWISNSTVKHDDVLKEIQDIFNELGRLEGVQVFGNVKGGFGHVGASNTQRWVFVP